MSMEWLAVTAFLVVCAFEWGRFSRRAPVAKEQHADPVIPIAEEMVDAQTLVDHCITANRHGYMAGRHAAYQELCRPCRN